MIDVSYMTHMGCDNLVTDAARVSFNKQADQYGDNQNETLLTFLPSAKLYLTFVLQSLTFSVSAPIIVSRQLLKHPFGGAVNEVSRRYIKSNPIYWKPEFFRAGADDVKQGSSSEPHRRSDEFVEDYHDICIDAIATYNKMIAVGICAEQARAILPQGAVTEWVWTGSLLFWSRVYNLRIKPDTQKETRDFAELLGEQMEALYPISWKALTHDQ